MPLTTGWPPRGWIDQGQCLGDEWGTEHQWSEDDRLTTICQIAYACVGLSPTDDVYRDALYPWDTVAAADDMVTKQYKCALTGLMIARAYGFDWPEDGRPYTWSFRRPPGKPAVHHAMLQVQRVDAWEVGKIMPKPGEGGIIYMPGSDALTHFYTCVGYSDPTTMVTVDGGKAGVHLTERKVVHSRTDITLQDKYYTRSMLGVLHTGRLRPSRNWVLPDR